MNTSNFSNPLAPGFNPLASNPLGGASISAPKKQATPTASVAKLEEQLKPPTEYVNHYIQQLCTGNDMNMEVSKFESSKIRLRNKAIKIIEVLNNETIDLDKLRVLVFTGIPDCIAGLRPLVWRIINQGLPLQTSQWKKAIEEGYSTYEDFKSELIVKPKLKDEEQKS